MKLVKGLEGWLKEVAIDFAIGFLTRLVNGGIGNDQLIAYGEKAGKFLTDHCKAPLGDKWEELESVLQDKVGVAFVGLMQGLDYDDKE